MKLYNEEFDHANINSFRNLFEHNSFETFYDKIDFLEEHEKDRRFLSKTRVKFINSKAGLSRGYDYNLYQFQPNILKLRNQVHDLQITWINHATFLIQFGKEVNILTDPHFGELPFSKIFKKLRRHAPSVLTPKDLDFVNSIVISHNHFDHLDFKTLNLFRKDISYFVPLKVEKNFGKSFSSITAMDWYTEKRIKDIRVIFVPAQHWSSRGYDKRKTLWGGFVFEKNNFRIYFAGDTAYSSIFSDIKKRLGPIDICLLPIIGYKPLKYRKNHMSPEEALQAAEDLHCKILFPWGQGTFTLGHEHILEPQRRFMMAYNSKRWPFKIKVLKMGETFFKDF